MMIVKIVNQNRKYWIYYEQAKKNKIKKERLNNELYNVNIHVNTIMK